MILSDCCQYFKEDSTFKDKHQTAHICGLKLIHISLIDYTIVKLKMINLSEVCNQFADAPSPANSYAPQPNPAQPSPAQPAATPTLAIDLLFEVCKFCRSKDLQVILYSWRGEGGLLV